MNEKGITVRVTRQYAFSAERVFDAWLDPVLAAKWLFTNSSGRIVRAEVDPRVGGRFTFADLRDGEEVEHVGEYLEIDRPHRLVFTFAVPKYSPDFDRVTIDITPQGGGCELTLAHEIAPEWISYARGAQNAWLLMLEGLAAGLGEERAATNLTPGCYPAPGEVRFVRLLPGPIERVWSYLVDGEKRKRWLAGGPLEEKVGGRADLFFRHADIAPDETPLEKYKEQHDPGMQMHGRVTQCEPPRLLSYTWFWEPPDEPSEVTFVLTPKGQNVELVLTHRRLGTNRETLACVGAGWHTHLGFLVALVSETTLPSFWAGIEQREVEYVKYVSKG